MDFNTIEDDLNLQFNQMLWFFRQFSVAFLVYEFSMITFYL